MARIRVAKATSGAAFLTKKKETEARLAAAAAAMSTSNDNFSTGNGPATLATGKASTSNVLDVAQLVASNSEDLFELQHHHLLQCLERTTVNLSIFFSFVYNH